MTWYCVTDTLTITFRDGDLDVTRITHPEWNSFPTGLDWVFRKRDAMRRLYERPDMARGLGNTGELEGLFRTIVYRALYRAPKNIGFGQMSTDAARLEFLKQRGTCVHLYVPEPVRELDRYRTELVSHRGEWSSYKGDGPAMIVAQADEAIRLVDEACARVMVAELLAVEQPRVQRRQEEQAAAEAIGNLLAASDGERVSSAIQHVANLVAAKTLPSASA